MLSKSSLAILASLSAALGGSTAPAQTTTPAGAPTRGALSPDLGAFLPDLVQNSVESDGRVVVFLRDETASSTDWNGDGDLSDQVVHIWDSTQQTSWNTGLVADTQTFVRDGDFCVLEVDESMAEADLNADGDESDILVHVLDLETRTVRSTGLTHVDGRANKTEGTGTGVEIAGDLVLVAVSDQLEWRDWLGDGDMVDLVYVIYSISTGEFAPLPMASAPGLDALVRIGEHVAFMALENGNANRLVDVNADGDFDDLYTTLIDTRTGQVVLMPFEGFPYECDGLLFSFAPEAVRGVDLTGDGDLDDAVIQFIDPVSGATARGPYALDTFPFPDFRAFGTSVAVEVEEEWLGQDLNADGDTIDVLHALHDVRTGAVTLLPLITGPAEEDSDRQLIYRAREALNPIQNGDADDDDRLPIVIDLDAGTLTPVPIAIPLATQSVHHAGQLFLSADEPDQGATDLDGDGDALDRVLMSYDLQTGVTSSFGLSSTASGDIGPVVVDGLVLYRAVEAANGVDLNSDGDLDDVLFVQVDPVTGTRTNLAIPSAGFTLAPIGSIQWLVVPEEELGDRNGDGDDSDDILVPLGVRDS